MSEMIERVARAIDLVSTAGMKGRTDRMLLEACARAAIEAMREPAKEMLERGLMAGTNLTTGQPSARLAARTAGERMTDQWQAMIDAALNEKSPTATS